MSSLTSKFPLILVGLIFGLAVLGWALGDEETDPILRYYWRKAGEAAQARLPVYQQASYELTARVWYSRLGDDGRAVRSDSAVIRYFFAGSVLDSQLVDWGDGDLFRRFVPAPPDVFAMPYHLHFFPNDTGGLELPIGFRADSADTESPDGVVIIHRREHTPLRLYLAYGAKPGYRRVSQFFRLAEQDGLLVPDSLSEVAVREGVFGLESYRIEAVVSDVRRSR
jgi:hypothetical protein